jgi:hypothetical protein
MLRLSTQPVRRAHIGKNPTQIGLEEAAKARADQLFSATIRSACGAIAAQNRLVRRIFRAARDAKAETHQTVPRSCGIDFD